MSDRNSIVVVYGSDPATESAVKELQHSGIDIEKLSILGKEYPTEEHAGAGDRTQYWGKMGAVWDGLWGLLSGAASFAIPGIGPVLIAGPLAVWMMGALEGAAAVSGLSVLGAGLFGMGIPQDCIVRYESALIADKFVLVAHGTSGDVIKLKDILKRTSPEESHMHFEDQGVLTAA